MIATTTKTVFQAPLFDTQPFAPRPKSLYEQIEWVPEEMQHPCFTGWPKTVGMDVGRIYVDKETCSHGYLVVLKFADGSLYSFHPMALFPSIDEKDKKLTNYSA